MNKKIITELSANTLQVLFNQFLGVFIFLLISRYLDKPVFGELSWSLAILTFTTTILSLRLEQIVVRNVAAGDNAGKMLTLFAGHNLVAGTIFFTVLSIICWSLPAWSARHSLLWILAISQLLQFFSLPFRQLLTGRSSFTWLALLSSVSNLIRAVWLFLLISFSTLTIQWVLIVFTVSALAEFAAGALIVCVRLKISPSFRWKLSDYVLLVKGALPQIGLVFLNAGIARADWILMGFLSTPGKTAEYSFAYRAYEFAPLPLLVLAPFILNRFARGKGELPDRLVRWEMVLATLPSLLLIMVWAPGVDLLTHGKYGASNTTTFLILCCCIPFQYLINLFWSYEFAINRLQLILRYTAITAAVVIAGDLVLIPLYGGPGAAASCLAAMVTQYMLYHRVSSFSGKKRWAGHLLLATAIAVISGFAATALAESLWVRLGVAGMLYAALAAGTRLLRIEDIPLAWRRAIGGWVDWPLLLFLVLFLNVKFYIKVAAILLALYHHRRHALPGREYLKKWLGFYLAMIVLAALNFLFAIPEWSLPSVAAFLLGSLWWVMAMLAAWYTYLFIQQGEIKRLHRTATCLFLLNAGVMLFIFARICVDAGTINPYTYAGEHQKYFVSTGDLINGISLDGSVTAALISSFGVLYFLYQNKKILSVICMTTVLLAGSNFMDLFLMATLIVALFFRTSLVQKGMIFVYGFMMIFFALKVSPENREYAMNLLSRLGGRHPYEVPLIIPQPRPIDLIEKKELVEKREQLGGLMGALYTVKSRDSLTRQYHGWEYSGKWVALQELGVFFREHPFKALLGTGMGNFSSRLAYKTAGLGIDGSYPEKKRYIHPLFRNNYLFIYLYYHSRDAGQHSVINRSDSVYGQLLSEYGIVGIACFLGLYVAFFARRARKLSYGLPVMLLLGAAFLTGYWFEQLTVVVIFEFLLFLDKRNIDTYA